MRSSAIETPSLDDGFVCDGKMDSDKFEVKKFSFLPKMIFERHQEYLYLRLVEDIISDGNMKDDRTGTGTLSKFGCQVYSVSEYRENIIWVLFLKEEFNF